MQTTVQLTLSPKAAADDETIKAAVAAALQLNPSDFTAIRQLKRSVDARSRDIRINLRVEAWWNEPAPTPTNYATNYPNVANRPEVIIVGAGPAGLFAALELIEAGLKPVILERGTDVRSRRRDLAAINKDHIVNPESNYCFGEGGAGTYSDGKLYTRSKKRGSITKVLETFVAHGASEDILVEAHPHIGTNKLPKLVAALRETILAAGGEVHFGARVDELLLTDNRITGVKLNGGDTVPGIAVILATGHSARDIYEMLHRQQLHIEAKPFAMGVRIEHPQALIDQIQYHCSAKEVTATRAFLPAAAYSLVHQSRDRGVFSFCMCPGGFIVPAATAPGEIVVNGMSPSKRDSRFANSGIVVAIELEDLTRFSEHGPLAGMRYQQQVEQLAWKAGGETQAAPAQRMSDFCSGRLSANLPDTSYVPGITNAPLHEVLPKPIRIRLQEGLKNFGSKLHGYYTNEAVLLGVESRTSSPVRIPRDGDTLAHPQVENLYPCGEGAGFAGGIVSAALDGMRVAVAIAATVKQ